MSGDCPFVTQLKSVFTVVSLYIKLYLLAGTSLGHRLNRFFVFKHTDKDLPLTFMDWICKTLLGLDNMAKISHDYLCHIDQF